jgi:hypothetical protein
VSKDHTVQDYYRACAAEMMAKAQAAPSKAIRQAYLNLALNWAQQAPAPSESGLGPMTPPTPPKKN